MQLKNEIIVKRIVIEWIKPPSFFKIEYCDIDNNCNVKSYKNEIIQFTTYLSEIYEKLFKFQIILMPQLESHTNYCIYSIKHISIFKNEILLDPVLTSELYGEDMNTQLFYTDNFIITRIDDVKLGINLQSKLSENVNLSDTIPEKITSTFSLLNKLSNDESKGSLNDLIYQIEINYREYSIKNQRSTSMIKLLFKHLQNFGASPYSNYLDINKYETLTKMRDLKDNLDDLKMITAKNKMKNEKIEAHKIINNSYTYLENLVEQNNKLAEQESTFFEETNSDKYRYKLNAKLRFLKYLVKVFDNLDFFSKIRGTFSRCEKILADLENYNAEWTKTMYEMIDEYYDEFIQAKKNDLNNLMKNLEISLQNIKLIRLSDSQLYLNIYNKKIHPSTHSEYGAECKETNLLKYTYYDNFFAKLMINYNQTNIQSENLIIVKFINSRLFYYMKVEFSKIELWYKNLENHNKIGEYNIFTETDKYVVVKDFSKLVFIMVKIYQGLLTLNVQIQYNPIPKEIGDHLLYMKSINYDKLISLYMDDYNQFQHYYKNSTVLYNSKHVNLVIIIS